LLKVESGGPWLFRQSVVCIEPYDGPTDPDMIDLNYFSTWVQIKKVPIGHRNETLLKNLVEQRMGKVEETQLDVNGAGNFVRVKVRLDVRRELERWVSMIRGGQRVVYLMKYEKCHGSTTKLL
jgi:hypothetical protein